MEKTRKQRIEEMLAEEPNDAFLRYGLAMEYVSAGQDEEAVNCFHELLRVAPEYVAGYMQAGRALTRLDRIEDARAIYGLGIEAALRQNDQHAAEEMASFREGLN